MQGLGVWLVPSQSTFIPFHLLPKVLVKGAHGSLSQHVSILHKGFIPTRQAALTKRGLSENCTNLFFLFLLVGTLRDCTCYLGRPPESDYLASRKGWRILDITLEMPGAAFQAAFSSH
eukprot:1153836-Pelagomonas_calceolata.AAC.1